MMARYVRRGQCLEKFNSLIGGVLIRGVVSVYMQFLLVQRCFDNVLVLVDTANPPTIGSVMIPM